VNSYCFFRRHFFHTSFDFILSVVVDYKKDAELTQNSISLKEKYIEEEFAKIRNIAGFLELKEHSTNDRQNILENLIKLVRLPINEQLDQASHDQKIKMLSSTLTSCDTSKEKYKASLSKAIRYFENPTTSKDFKKVIDKLLIDESPLERHTAYVSEEGKQWEALCSLCQDELNKARNEQIQRLNDN
jgi:hypothetical protein